MVYISEKLHKMSDKCKNKAPISQFRAVGDGYVQIFYDICTIFRTASEK